MESERSAQQRQRPMWALTAAAITAITAITAMTATTLLALPRAGRAQGPPIGRRAPGTPLPAGATGAKLDRAVTRLPSQVEPGDVVLLRPGGKRGDRGDWVAVIRFDIRASRESAVGFATIIPKDGTDFRGLTLHQNVVFVERAADFFSYQAEDRDARLRGRMRKAMYRVNEALLRKGR